MCCGRYLKRPVITRMNETANIVNRRIFSHGSSMLSTKVDSNHILRRHRKRPSLDLGGRVKERSGLGLGSVACVGVAMAKNNELWRGMVEWVQQQARKREFILTVPPRLHAPTRRRHDEAYRLVMVDHQGEPQDLYTTLEQQKLCHRRPLSIRLDFRSPPN